VNDLQPGTVDVSEVLGAWARDPPGQMNEVLSNDGKYIHELPIVS